MTPVLLRALGDHDYGLWQIVTGLLGYLGLLEVGVKPALSRFIATAIAQGRREKAEAYLSSAFFFALLIAICAATTFALWAALFPGVLSGEAAKADDFYRTVLFWVAAYAAVSFLTATVESAFEGFQLYTVKNLVTMVFSTVVATVIFTNIQPESALIFLAQVTTLSSAAKLSILLILLSLKRLAGILPRPTRASRVVLKELIAFGLKTFAFGASARVERTALPIIIGAVIGPAGVPYFTIPATLIQYVAEFAMTLTHAFMPMFAALQASAQKETLAKYYLGLSRVVVALVVPLAIGILLLGPPFIKLWIGAQYAEIAQPIIALLLIYNLLPFLNPSYNRYLMAIGEHGILARIGPLAAAVNLGVGIPLTIKFGLLGAAVGAAIPVSFWVPFILHFTMRSLGLTVAQYVRGVFQPALLPCLLMTIALLLLMTSGPPESYMRLCGVAALGAMSYLISYLAFSISLPERLWLRERIRKAL
jgi:O-antigen/teichoic acid export membrane protein